MLQAWRCFIIHSCRIPLPQTKYWVLQGRLGRALERAPHMWLRLSGTVLGWAGWGDGNCWKDRLFLDFEISRCWGCGVSREERAALVPGSLCWGAVKNIQPQMLSPGLQPQLTVVHHLSRGRHTSVTLTDIFSLLSGIWTWRSGDLEDKCLYPWLLSAAN